MASILKVDQIQTPSGGAPTLVDLGVNTQGSVVDAYTALYTAPSTFTGVSGGFRVLPNLQITLTPKSANSKFMVFARVFGEAGDSDGHNWSMAIACNGNYVNAGDASGNKARVICTAGADYNLVDIDSTPQTWNASTLYVPNTASALTFNVLMTNQGGTATFYWNQTANATDNMARERGSSELTILEIA